MEVIVKMVEILCSKYLTSECGLKERGYDCNGIIKRNPMSTSGYFCIDTSKGEVFQCETSELLKLTGSMIKTTRGDNKI